jgi:Ca2+-binding RTX toxin-like protein
MRRRSIVHFPGPLGRVFLAAAVIALLSPALASGARVAVFDDPAFVDTANTSDAESDNVQGSLAALGHSVKTFTGTSAADFSAGLAGVRLLVVPELEEGDLGAALSPDARRTLRMYVATGGGLIVFDQAGGNTTTFLDTLFGFSLTAGPGSCPCARRAAAAGTAFAGGPASLPDNDATEPLDSASLPSGAKRIYRDGVDAAVVLFRVGAGKVVFLAWDWFDAEPIGSQGGGWNRVLNRSVAEVAGAGCTITGTSGADTLTGTGGRDRICARDGQDVVSAGGGKDTVLAGDGADTVNGQQGSDVLNLQDGGDRGFGSLGNDRITGGSGADELNGQGGRDRLNSRDGVRGNDHVNGGAQPDVCRSDRGDHLSSC